MINLLNKLNELKLDNKKMALIASICLLMVYLDSAFIIRLQLEGIRNASPKIIKLKKDFDNLSKDLSRLQDLERRQGKDYKQGGALKAGKIISENELLLLLQDVSDIANKNKVNLIQMDTSKDAKAQEELIAGERLLPITITLNLNCGYHQLGSFINALENNKQFVDVQDIKIVRDPRNYLLENVNLVLKTYAKK